jgi:Tfp pilus assembly protein PilF
LACYLQQDDENAEKYLLKALHLDQSLASSHYQLAKVYQREGKFVLALKQIDAADKLDPNSYPVHYVRGQVLQKLGRTQEAKAEMQNVTRMMNGARSKRQQELYGGAVPSPELTQESPQ